MPKRKKKRTPHTPPSNWDLGPATQAARHLSIVEERGFVDPKDGRYKNPNSVKGRRKISWLEHYGKRGSLTQRQVTAGLRLLEAFEQTQRSRASLQELRVDRTPQVGQADVIRLERLHKFHRIARHIPKAYKAHIDHVALQNRPVSSLIGKRGKRGGRQTEVFLERLAKGLDILADRLET